MGSYVMGMCLIPPFMYVLFFIKGDMEEALERYDVCVGLFKFPPRTGDTAKLSVHLPNLSSDASITLEEVRFRGYTQIPTFLAT